MDETSHRQIVERQIEQALEHLFPQGAGPRYQLTEHLLQQVADVAWREGQSYILLNLKTIQDVAETYGISERRARALAAERHARFGIGYQVPGTRAWLFQPEEIASLAPGPQGWRKGRPRKQQPA